MLPHLLLGALLGGVGQMIRALVGMKKLYEQAQASNQSIGHVFEPVRFFISLAIGATAGLLADLAFVESGAADLPREAPLLLVGAGYAGTDFLEGFLRHASEGAALLARPSAQDTVLVHTTDLDPPPLG
jgi:hypothetical protein